MHRFGRRCPGTLAALACVLAAAMPATAQPAVAEHYTGLAEASAAAMLDAQHFIVAEDECNVLLVYRLGDPTPVGAPVDLRAFLKAGKRASDLEAGARVGDVIYWISSHSRNSKGEHREARHRFFATRIEPGPAGAAPIVRPTGSFSERLLQDMKDAPSLKDLKLDQAADKKPEAQDGLNIEGLAAGRDGGLLIGFRNPLREGKAILVPLANPGAVVQGERASVGVPVLLDLGGRGVRSLVQAGDHYVIVAGPVADAGDFAVYHWSGDPKAAPQRRAGIAPGFHAEAVLSLGDGRLMLLSDDGATQAEAHCGSAQKAAQRFRALRLQLK